MAAEIIFRILSDPWAIFLVVLFFGASIFIHELGHYLAARWRGLKVERFSVGFGPRLFGWRDKQGVDWRVSLFPLGGYVSLPQLADLRGLEGEAKHTASELPPISYADKMYVAAAGAFFNVLFAIAIATVLWVTGIDVPAEMDTTRVGIVSQELEDADGMHREGPARRAGIQPGDHIITIDGKEIKDWQDLTYAITTGTGRSENGNPRTVLGIERNGTRSEITVFPVLDDYEGIRRIGIAPASRLIVGDTMENSPAQKAGLLPQDEIIAANGTHLFHTMALSEIIHQNPEEPIRITVLREGNELELEMTPQDVVYNKAGETMPMIGIRWQPQSERAHINPFTLISDSVSVTLRVLGALLHPKSDVGINNLSGPVGISYTLYVISQISLFDVLSIVVLININLAILNLLPIPVLDGGHMAFATIGKLRGKPIPPNIIASAQGIFMILFLGIFVYVTFFDVGRVQRNESAMIEAEHAAKQRIPIVFSAETENSETENK